MPSKDKLLGCLIVLTYSVVRLKHVSLVVEFLVWRIKDFLEQDFQNLLIYCAFGTCEGVVLTALYIYSKKCSDPQCGLSNLKDSWPFFSLVKVRINNLF